MTSLRPSRATYIAAFILGALIALLLVRPGRSAEPYRLDRIGVVGFTHVGTGHLVHSDLHFN